MKVRGMSIVHVTGATITASSPAAQTATDGSAESVVSSLKVV